MLLAYLCGIFASTARHIMVRAMVQMKVVLVFPLLWSSCTDRSLVLALVIATRTICTKHLCMSLVNQKLLKGSEGSSNAIHSCSYSISGLHVIIKYLVHLQKE